MIDLSRFNYYLFHAGFDKLLPSRYFITGRIDQSISVNIDTGELRTLIDNAFDYDRQTEIFVQVQARDTLQTRNEPTHTTFTQVRIQVNDVNNKPPQLKMVFEQLVILC